MRRGPLTICPYCGCGCGIYLHIEDGAALGTSPCLEHPVSRGGLCVKGWNAHQFVNHPQRLRTPSLRLEDELRAVTWDEALSFVSRELIRIREVHGPDSIGFLSSAKCTNEENYLLMKLSRAAVGTNNIDHCARL